MNKIVEEEANPEERDSAVRKKYPRHPMTIENTPEETIRRMQAFPQRAAKLRETIRATGKSKKSQDRIIPLATENSPEETIRRLKAFPERKARFLELLRALREADTR